MANKEKTDNFDPLYSPQPNGSDELSKFTDILLEKKGQILELYIGDQFLTLNYDDYSQPQNSSIFGRLIDVLDRFIVLDCFYHDKRTNSIKSGNITFINSFQIRAMTVVDGEGSLDDIFMSVKDSKAIKKYMHIQSKHLKGNR